MKFKAVIKDKNLTYTQDEVKIFRQRKIEFYKTIIDNSAYLNGLPNINDFVKFCNENIGKLAICSGATREEIEATLIKLENGTLKKYFSNIITIDDISIGKPNPEGYLLTANHLTIQPEDCLVIEDTPKGIAAAKQANMSVAAITTSYEPIHLKNADLIANNYEQIREWICHFK